MLFDLTFYITPTGVNGAGTYTFLMGYTGGAYTIGFTGIKWPGGTAPYWSNSSGSKDIFTLFYNNTDYYGQASMGYA